MNAGRSFVRPEAHARRQQGTPQRVPLLYVGSRGFGRDEYPPAVGRGHGKGLERGSDPTGWKADVRYVPSDENRAQGSALGAKLHRFCNGTKFRYAFF